VSNLFQTKLQNNSSNYPSKREYNIATKKSNITIRLSSYIWQPTKYKLTN